MNEIDEQFKEFEKIISDLKKLKFRCWLCGKPKDLTKHHITPQKIVGKVKTGTIPLCKECHRYIEDVKAIIEIMKKEKRLSVTRFKQLLKTLEKKDL